MELNIIEADTEETLQGAYAALTRLFRVMAHPARLAILDMLRQGEACVCHLEAALGYRQAYLSQQLAVLREAGLVQVRREGWNIYYQILDTAILNVLDEARRLTHTQDVTPQRAGNCPCPKCNQDTHKELEPVLPLHN